jgi:hypothetical protein
MRGSSAILLMVLLVACLAMVTPVWGAVRAGVTVAEVERLFREAWDRAADLPALNQTRMDFAVSMSSGLDARSAAELRVRVTGKPDHPDAQRLRQHEHEQRFGPSQRLITIWFDSSARWRTNWTTRNTPDGDYFFDVARSPQSVWRLSGKQLALMRPGSSEAESASSGVEGTVGLLQSIVFSQGLQALRQGDARWHSVAVRGNQWELKVTQRSGEWTVRGGIEQVSGEPRLRVKRAEVTSFPDYPDGVGMGWEALEFAEHASFGTIVKKYRDFMGGSGAAGVIEFLRLESVPDETIEQLVQRPTTERPDPVRGRLTFTSIIDESGNESRLYNGEWMSARAARLAAAQAGSGAGHAAPAEEADDRASSWERLRMVIVSLGGIAAILLCVRAWWRR